MRGVERHWYPLSGAETAVKRAGMSAAAVKESPPIDALTGPKFALAGRVITMDNAFTVIDDGVVYVDRGVIVAVRVRTDAPPDGFADTAVLDTGGSIYPGLIELHNHLSYNALGLWSPVPKLYTDRGQWPKHPDYRRLISGPMTVVGEYRDAKGNAALLAPLVRYVECKCLLGGVTASQGIMLNSNAGVQRYYRGILRNVEQTDDPALPEAQARIADIDAKDARSFLKRLNKEDSCFLLHLSEGVTPDGSSVSVARKHFLALEVAPDEWAINDRLAAIHSAGLLQQDFDVLGRLKGSMVWSPLSNMLLYGATARVEAARAAGVRIGLGSDWSPSGSKNLLGELKVAWLYSQQILGGRFSAKELLAMATRDAAKILKWDRALGALEANMRADLVVVNGNVGEPYEAFIRAKETDISLVVINGVARYGVPPAMQALGAKGEPLKVGGQSRQVFLQQATGDPDVAQVTLKAATTKLSRAFKDLKTLARGIEKPKFKKAFRMAADAPRPIVWTLALDEIKDTGFDQRPRLPFDGPRDFTGPKMLAASAKSPPLSAILGPIELDPLTVADDPNYLTRIGSEPNVPASIRASLGQLY
jgi:5-methylthioadenosine/S-adenosylhomocysteine deaminase